MRLGIIADTHGRLPASVFGAFEAVDHILHAGDIGGADVLIELEALATVTAVFGNTDGADLRRRCPRVAKLDLEGFYVTVTHGDQFGEPEPRGLHEAFAEADIIVYGHTHRPTLELVDRTVTVMNPGSAGAPRGGRARVGRDHGVGTGHPTSGSPGAPRVTINRTREAPPCRRRTR